MPRRDGTGVVARARRRIPALAACLLAALFVTTLLAEVADAKRDPVSRQPGAVRNRAERKRRIREGPFQIEIRIGEQHAYVFVRDSDILVRRIPVSTGRNGATPLGTFHIYSKSASTSASSNSSVTMQWMSRFLGGYGMHAIPRSNGVPISTPLGQEAVSHGCVRMADADAKWVYDTLVIGTPVIIRN